MQDRRQFLTMLGRTVLVAGMAGAGARDIGAQTFGAGPALQALRNGLWCIRGAGVNLVVAESAEGLIMVDSGAPQHAEALVTLLDEHFGEPVTHLFNTCWHPDHTGGNDIFGRRGAAIVAHENTRLWMSAEFYVDWQDRTFEPRSSDARPTDTFYSHEPQPIGIRVGSLQVEYAHLKQARTDGDLYVHFPQLDVIAAGAVVTGYEYPALDYVTGGWIGGLVEATARLEALAGADTVIVPGQGATLRREDLAAQRDMLETVRQRIEELALQGKGASEMAAAGVTAEFDDRWRGDARRFVETAYEGIWWANRLRGMVA